jgi:hypothetical protein
VFVNAIANDDIVTYATGEGTSGNLGVAASASAPRMDSQIDSYIGQGADIVVRKAGEADPLGVWVLANHFVDSMGVAGTVVGSLQTGVGAAADLKQFNKRVKAHIDGPKLIDVQDDVTVDAVSHEHLDAVVVGLAASLEASLAGSVAYADLKKQTFAYIDDGRVLADDNVVIRADSHTQFDPEAGAGAVALGGGVGFSGSLLQKADDTRAYITNKAMVDAKATGGVIQVYTGQKVLGVRQTKPVKGVVVSATNQDETGGCRLGQRDRAQESCRGLHRCRGESQQGRRRRERRTGRLRFRVG